MTKIGEKAAQDFHRAVSKVLDRVKSVALWSANIRKLAKEHKSYGSTANTLSDMWIIRFITYLSIVFHIYLLIIIHF
jgi:hypothetical protein